jgi:hypothetical protein
MNRPQPAVPGTNLPTITVALTGGRTFTRPPTAKGLEQFHKNVEPSIRRFEREKRGIVRHMSERLALAIHRRWGAAGMAGDRPNEIGRHTVERDHLAFAARILRPNDADHFRSRS